jgi:hypothetical protein
MYRYAFLCFFVLLVVATTALASPSSSSSSSSLGLRGLNVHNIQSGKYIQSSHIRMGNEPWMNFTQHEYAFTQQLMDHFDMTNNERYTQRYWIVDDFFNVNAPTPAPVIFLLCGEYTCPGVMPTRLYPVQLAYLFEALIVVIEHRYYGESYPNVLTDDHLYLLNSRQALADFAYFQQWFAITYLKNEVPILPTPSNPSPPNPIVNPWIVISGSYPGALSAWYRIKYPHLVIASIASSAVVQAILEFPAFDEQVAVSAGPECADALRTLTKIIESRMPAIKKSFNASIDMHDGDFLFLIADIGAEGVQYGHREMLCNAIVPPFQQNATEELLNAFINYTAVEFYAAMGSSPSDYDRKVWKEPTQGNADRSWGFQTCAELGYWQVAPKSNPIRSTQINRTYYEDLCFDVFGRRDLPEIEATNSYYGGNHYGGNMIFSINGVEDPWQWATHRELVVNCSQCAHCVDLYTPTETDAPELVEARAAETAFLADALQLYAAQFDDSRSVKVA